MKIKITQTIKIIALGLILSAGIAFAQTWTGPTGAPPASNVAAPINVSSANQVKAGALGTGPLVVFGSEAGVQSSSSSAIFRATTPAAAFCMNCGPTSRGWFGAADWFGNNTGGVGIWNDNTSGSASIALLNDGKVTVNGSGLAHSNSTSQPVCITSTGQLALCATAAPTGMQTYITPGTYSFTVPAGVTSLDVLVWAGGGGGGGGGGSVCCINNHGGGASGGGAGGYTNKTISVTPNSQLTIIVGSGGNAGGGGSTGSNSGSNGASGTASQIKLGNTVLASASPGAAGNLGYAGSTSGDGGNNPPGGAGGYGETQFGGNGVTGSFIGGGNGGSSPSGGNGGSGGGSPPCNSNGSPGSNGANPGAGGGGGGGANPCSGAARAGGAGGAGAGGKIIINW